MRSLSIGTFSASLIHREIWQKVSCFFIFFWLLGCSSSPIPTVHHNQVEVLKLRYGTLQDKAALAFFERLAKRLKIPTPTILESDNVVALSDGARASVISRGTICKVFSEDELAFVFAHEAAHIFLQHAVGETKSAELEADSWAMVRMHQAHYHLDGALQALHTFSGSHVLHGEEYERLKNISTMIAIMPPAFFRNESREYNQIKKRICSNSP